MIAAGRPLKSNFSQMSYMDAS